MCLTHLVSHKYLFPQIDPSSFLCWQTQDGKLEGISSESSESYTAVPSNKSIVLLSEKVFKINICQTSLHFLFIDRSDKYSKILLIYLSLTCLLKQLLR